MKDRIQTFLKSRLCETIIFIGSTALHLFLIILLYSSKLLKKYGNITIWKAVNTSTGLSYYSSIILKVLAIILIVLFFLEVVTIVGAYLIFFLKKKRFIFNFLIPFQLILSFSILGVQIFYPIFSSVSFLLILMIIDMIIALVYLLYIREPKEEENIINEQEIKNIALYKKILLIIESIGMFAVMMVFFVPLFSNVLKEEKVSYILFQIGSSNDTPIYIQIFLMGFLIAFFGCILYYISTITYYFKTSRAFILKAKLSIFSQMAVTFMFFLLGYLMTFITNIQKGNADTIAIIPFLVSLVLFLLYSIFQGKLGIVVEENFSEIIERKYKIIPLVFVVIFTAITSFSLFARVVEIKFSTGFTTKNVSLTGYELLTTYKTLSAGFQGLAFILFTFFLSSGLLLVLSIVSFCSKYKDYYKVIKAASYANVIFMMLLALFGFYYQIAQKINEENILSVLDRLGIQLPTDYKYTVSSQMMYLFSGSMIVLILMMIFGQLNHKIEGESKSSYANSINEKPLFKNANSSAIIDFDACPAFTELDSKLEKIKMDLAEKRKHLFQNLTLPNLVRFVVDYARECRLHLSYSLEDIATFVAGLGASRLAILQGMSGTGKTSLPKIFTEAIMGVCEVVEVESSWRDKNELLGYYNEFSKCFTPKKFTQCLYKARLNSEVPTFIVLDEMNLSRIEYYFSDFLSLMEHEEHQRQIKLLNVKLYRTSKEEAYEYYGLIDGHTISIPTNVWFIGTANRDESTFEISDKVYDRAQTMNFNKRAPKIHSFSEPLENRYVSYEQLSQLFKEAKENHKFEAEDDPIIQKVEKLLLPYNISFGNRILKQMEDFVKVYCACFGDKEAVLKEAVEKILLSKVVAKLETKIIENKEALALDFDKLGLMTCSAFIRKLNED